MSKDEMQTSTVELELKEEDSTGNVLPDSLDSEYEPTDSPRRKDRWWSPKWHLLEIDRFVTSYIISTKVLFAYRLIVFLFMTAVMICQGIYNQFDNGTSFRYFTWMSFFSLYFYFIAAALHTGVAVFYGRPILLEKSPKFLNCLYWLLYELMCTYHIIVPVIYWVLLSADAPDPATEPLSFFINVSVHGVDAVLIITDEILGRNIMLISHILFMILFALCYCAYAWIWYAFGWPLPYEFLSIPIYYVLLPIGFSILYLLQWFVHFGKEKVFAKRYAAKMAEREDSYSGSA